MTRQTLRTATLQTVATATKAAERTVGAYRAGGHRLVAVIQQRLTAPTAERAQPYAPRLAAALRSTSHQAGSLADKGIDLVSDRTEQAISVASKGVAAQVKRVAQLADGVDNRVIANGLDTAARITLPGVQAALALTERLADGADKLARSAAGAKPGRSQRATTKAPVRRAAAGVKRTVKAAAQPVVKAAAKPLADAIQAVKKAKTAQAAAKPAKPAKAPAAA
ncbi:hypothetical protein [Aquabacterium sp. OR-4]|uniref:hypothetical protein n=1 Tax=Aquabacterium sp. OR-4 TaxID=2978127 RepID=UPI0021B17051|nr:hypothetical protein [Aquabacterium sp. OR-4]MDT7836821.1 hypothetical protein [Aquabacterium sp. OR-4]